MGYTKLSKEVIKNITEDRDNNIKSMNLCKDEMVVRRIMDRDKANLWRGAFVRDIEKILHSPYYNRYTDKTQVFSFYRNDDISRRSLHVQLVSRIGRNIGEVLGLNTNLIEAIALGHDIGHTPFGHAGERFLSKLLYENTGRYFNHNVHSVRVLDDIFKRNISLQTLDGILCHNGEFELQEYRPCILRGFEEFDQKVEECYSNQEYIGTLIPSTLEGCVVRICDMIAYIGKDRQDAERARLLPDGDVFSKGKMGTSNAEIINNISVNIIENSYGKDYILLDEDIYGDLKRGKKENYQYIYFNENMDNIYKENIEPMFKILYKRLLDDLVKEDKSSIIYKHHIDFVNEQRGFYQSKDYEKTEINQIVVDYIASMTDDYFVDLFNELFPNSLYKIEYISYFK